ncbi:uncharacterized protein L3040_001596 [Drepanopeziza brunnea f. sp. 'multigermtubi']|uniref:Putative importin beta-4 subunit n=1 Tax=Marssonina brunnea f. sp. multigermtubi (strain MB_m1) TaxID=1072389 RepID=K1WQH1_MARBU|nr:putative importin beta-4 subunit [Drepanopeziza brunnea f. sp. 'multigermtubi' MB_m1]EKD15226.1 putative importin beta-4 subunit [Drepanopeziza brunnea f. sp. 'multigermtubi' MB_m1]KAJ5051825.1 hypothetical protein L3040_001596 [Drepanopeziza brunnea f. sp. 'multigermtubi']
MDQQKFVDLLQSIQAPDTERIKAATTELRKTYYPHPQSLLWLLHILTSHDAPEMRQQAAVEANRLIPKHWNDLPEDQKPAIREKLLESTLNELKPLVRHSAARVIASIASIDLADGEWASLPNNLFQAATSGQVSHREVGVYILFSLLEVASTAFEDKLQGLFTLLSKTIQDPESPEVRTNTLLCLGQVAMLIQPDEDPENLTRFNDIFPAMVAVLKSAVDSEDDDRVMQAFEVFQTFLGCESALLNKHFKDLLTFMIDLGADTSIPDESRAQALSFLMQCARYRKMKIQGIKDMGENLTLKAMHIATEIDDDEDDDDITPHKTALGLLDLLATALPPRMVVVPLLAALPKYVNSELPHYRQAGILSLGMCVEGAPDFIATQLDGLMPVVLKLLNDPEIGVRGAALNGIARLADDLAEELCKHHAELMPALLKNLDAATVQASSEAAQEKNLDMLKAACSAIDSVTDGVDKAAVASYIPEVVPRLVQLLSHSDLNVKGSAAGAIGSMAGSAMDAFSPYFEGTMEALSPYVTMKDSNEELDLRGIVCDAMGSISEAVGPVAFQKYVHPLMQASEEGLNLGHPRLRETSYILWSTLAKVYKEEFAPFLDGVVKALLASLNQEESDFEVELGEEARELLGQEVVIAGKKVKVASASDAPEDPENMEDDGDDEDWDDLTAVTAVALEKEVAIEVIGDVLSHTRKNFVPYFEKTIEVTVGLVEHSYEGVRKAAIGTLWRAYACLWALMEDHTGEGWAPGLPLKSQPSGELLKLGEVVTAATMSVWDDEVDRAVVTDINRNVAATLKLCGPAIMTQENFTERMTSTIASILTKTHPCQNDMGDEDEHDDEEESSEYDWLVIDTALDVIIGMAKALGEQFGEVFKIYQKPITKFASSSTGYERSTAIGVFAECTRHMGAAVTPFTSALLKLLTHKLSDEDPETKSNAAYAMGLLIYYSTDSAAYLPSYNAILSKLEPLLQTRRARTLDNACGCVCRMIMAHPDKVPIGDILPVLIDLLPLKEDYEENEPIFSCIAGLYQHENQDIISLTPQLIPVFAAVLGEPTEQLDIATRTKVIATVKFIASKNPSAIQGNPVLANCL